jgi:primosomal protein N' (replication factor Y)
MVLMQYFEIGVGVERHWKSAVFTYSSTAELSPGDIIQVPFGPKSKTGIVLRKASKPSFATKSVGEQLSVVLSSETQDFMEWFKQFYALEDGELYAQFLPAYLSKPSSKLKPDSVDTLYEPAPELSKAQQKAYEEIKATDKPTVLQGITGAGKTRIYSNLLLESIYNGKNALLLYPEISLTSQLVQELEKYAPVAVFHSQLTTKQRSNLWLQVAASVQPMIIAGPRSALFLPHKHIGVIIVDEAHEGAYKQESDVRYNGLLVAGGLAKAHGTKLVLGSATPPISETELIVKTGGSVVELHEKAIISDHTKGVHIINMKDPDAFKKHPLLADKLLGSITKNIQEKKQTLLFLNRRGTAKLLLCENCDWQSDCDDCDLPMTYHHDLHKMVCHTCNKKSSSLSICPECSHKTSLRSFGSKALVEEVQKLFPQAVIARFDSDTTKQESFNNRYNEVKDGKIDIIIGTQQLAKGLDLPKLKTVGVLQADLSLHFPDYSSNERTFQLISQVLGRVGRGHGDAEIFLQTYQPSNPIIQLAISEDWPAFRALELEQRYLHHFPPALFTAKLIFRHKEYEKAFSEATKVKSSIKTSGSEASIDGPLASFYGKRGGFYYIQLHIRAKKRSDILKICRGLPKSIIKDLDPITLL